MVTAGWIGVGEGVAVGGAAVAVGGTGVAVEVGTAVLTAFVAKGAGVSVAGSSSEQATTAVSSSSQQSSRTNNKPLPIASDCKQLPQKAKIMIYKCLLRISRTF
jgi:hypothetical protein